MEFTEKEKKYMEITRNIEKNIPTNLSAIQKMSSEKMAVILDYIYTTGLNDGMYIACLPDDSDEKNAILDNCPYNEEWLWSEAEDATRHVFDENGAAYLPEFFVKSVTRSAGIDACNEEV